MQKVHKKIKKAMVLAEFDHKPVVCRQNDTQQSPDCWVMGESEKYKLMNSM